MITNQEPFPFGTEISGEDKMTAQEKENEILAEKVCSFLSDNKLAGLCMVKSNTTGEFLLFYNDISSADILFAATLIKSDILKRLDLRG